MSLLLVLQCLMLESSFECAFAAGVFSYKDVYGKIIEDNNLAFEHIGVSKSIFNESFVKYTQPVAVSKEFVYVGGDKSVINSIIEDTGREKLEHVREQRSEFNSFIEDPGRGKLQQRSDINSFIENFGRGKLHFGGQRSESNSYFEDKRREELRHIRGKRSDINSFIEDTGKRMLQHVGGRKSYFNNNLKKTRKGKLQFGGQKKNINSNLEDTERGKLLLVKGRQSNIKHFKVVDNTVTVNIVRENMRPATPREALVDVKGRRNDIKKTFYSKTLNYDSDTVISPPQYYDYKEMFSKNITVHPHPSDKSPKLQLSGKLSQTTAKPANLGQSNVIQTQPTVKSTVINKNIRGKGLEGFTINGSDVPGSNTSKLGDTLERHELKSNGIGSSKAGPNFNPRDAIGPEGGSTGKFGPDGNVIFNPSGGPSILLDPSGGPGRFDLGGGPGYEFGPGGRPHGGFGPSGGSGGEFGPGGGPGGDIGPGGGPRGRFGPEGETGHGFSFDGGPRGGFGPGGGPRGEFGPGGGPGEKFDHGVGPGYEFGPGGRPSGGFGPGGGPGEVFSPGGGPGYEFGPGGRPRGRFDPGGRPGGEFGHGGGPGYESGPGGRPRSGFGPSGGLGGEFGPGGGPEGDFGPDGGPRGGFGPEGETGHGFSFDGGPRGGFRPGGGPRGNFGPSGGGPGEKFGHGVGPGYEFGPGEGPGGRFGPEGGTGHGFDFDGGPRGGFGPGGGPSGNFGHGAGPAREYDPSGGPRGGFSPGGGPRYEFGPGGRSEGGFGPQGGTGHGFGFDGGPRGGFGSGGGPSGDFGHGAGPAREYDPSGGPGGGFSPGGGPRYEFGPGGGSGGGFDPEGGTGHGFGFDGGPRGGFGSGGGPSGDFGHGAGPAREYDPSGGPGGGFSPGGGPRYELGPGEGPGGRFGPEGGTGHGFDFDGEPRGGFSPGGGPGGEFGPSGGPDGDFGCGRGPASEFNPSGGPGDRFGAVGGPGYEFGPGKGPQGGFGPDRGPGEKIGPGGGPGVEFGPSGGPEVGIGSGGGLGSGFGPGRRPGKFGPDGKPQGGLGPDGGLSHEFHSKGGHEGGFGSSAGLGDRFVPGREHENKFEIGFAEESSRPKENNYTRSEGLVSPGNFSPNLLNSFDQTNGGKTHSFGDPAQQQTKLDENIHTRDNPAYQNETSLQKTVMYTDQVEKSKHNKNKEPIAQITEVDNGYPSKPTWTVKIVTEYTKLQNHQVSRQVNMKTENSTNITDATTDITNTEPAESTMDPMGPLADVFPEEEALNAHGPTLPLTAYTTTKMTTTISDAKKLADMREKYEHSGPQNFLYSHSNPFRDGIRKEMKELHCGYFTIFLRRVLKMVAMKDPKHVHALVNASSFIIDLRNSRLTFRNWGQPFVKTVVEYAKHVRLEPVDVTQSAAGLAYMALEVRQETLSKDLNSIIDLVDELYTELDGEKIIEVLHEIHDFPNTTNLQNESYMIATKMLDNVFQKPFERLHGKINQTTLIESLNTYMSHNFHHDAGFEMPVPERRSDYTNNIDEFNNSTSTKLKEAESLKRSLILNEDNKSNHGNENDTGGGQNPNSDETSRKEKIIGTKKSNYFEKKIFFYENSARITTPSVDAEFASFKELNQTNYSQDTNTLDSEKLNVFEENDKENTVDEEKKNGKPTKFNPDQELQNRKENHIKNNKKENKHRGYGKALKPLKKKYPKVYDRYIKRHKKHKRKPAREQYHHYEKILQKINKIIRLHSHHKRRKHSKVHKKHKNQRLERTNKLKINSDEHVFGYEMRLNSKKVDMGVPKGNYNSKQYQVLGTSHAFINTVLRQNANNNKSIKKYTQLNSAIDTVESSDEYCSSGSESVTDNSTEDSVKMIQNTQPQHVIKSISTKSVENYIKTETTETNTKLNDRQKAVVKKLVDNYVHSKRENFIQRSRDESLLTTLAPRMNRNKLIKKITDASSYSDEEEHLKTNLMNALFHANDDIDKYFRFRRQFKTAKVNKVPSFDQSSIETDEENVIKTNIYKVFTKG